MIQLTCESLHNINDIVFAVRKDGSVVQGCVYTVILRTTSVGHALSYEVLYGYRSDVFCKKNLYSDPHDACRSTYQY